MGIKDPRLCFNELISEEKKGGKEREEERGRGRRGSSFLSAPSVVGFPLGGSVVVSNVYALKHLLLDFSLWRKTKVSIYSDP